MSSPLFRGGSGPGFIRGRWGCCGLPAESPRGDVRLAARHPHLASPSEEGEEWRRGHARALRKGCPSPVSEDFSAKRPHAGIHVLPPLQRGKWPRIHPGSMGVFWVAGGIALGRRASRGTPPPPGLPPSEDFSAKVGQSKNRQRWILPRDTPPPAPPPRDSSAKRRFSKGSGCDSVRVSPIGGRR